MRRIKKFLRRMTHSCGTDDLKGLACLIGGIVGLIGGSIGIWKEFAPPSVEIVGARPFAVVERFPSEDVANPDEEGISVIVHVRSKGREVSLAALDANGKIYLDTGEYLSLLRGQAMGRHIKEIDMERAKLQPYFKISWSAWPTDSRVPVRPEPFEERYVRFTFLEPKQFLKLPRFDGLMDAYVGFEDKAPFIIPTRMMTQPTVWHFFRQKVIRDGKEVVSSDVRDEIKSGNVRFSLRAGSQSIRISPKKLQQFARITQEAWEKEDPLALYGDR